MSHNHRYALIRQNLAAPPHTATCARSPQAAPHVRYHEPTVRVATSKTTRVPAMCHCQRRATSVRPTLTLPSEARCGQNTAGMGSRNPPRPALRSPRASAGRSSRRRPVSCSCSLRPAVSSRASQRAIVSLAVSQRPMSVGPAAKCTCGMRVCTCTVQLKLARCSVAMYVATSQSSDGRI